MAEIKKVGIVGIGRLGLPFALGLEKAGYSVTGVDLQQEYIESLKDRSYQSEEPHVLSLLKKSKIHFSTDFSDLTKAEIIFIFVATPSVASGEFSNEPLFSAFESLAYQKLATKEIVVSCTVMPGTCEALQEKYQDKFNILYNPAFIAQGSILKDFENPDLVLIGASNESSSAKLSSIWKKLIQNAPTFAVMKTNSAEITKVALNCFVTMKISFANLIGDFATQLNAEPQKILDAIGSDKRIGEKCLKYGFGYGGPCFPRDNRALSIAVEKAQLSAQLFRSVDSSNKQHLEFQVENFVRTHPKSEPVLQKGVSYNQKSALIEESQQLAFALKLAERGYRVKIEDRASILEELRKNFGDKFELQVAAQLHKSE